MVDTTLDSCITMLDPNCRSSGPISIHAMIPTTTANLLSNTCAAKISEMEYQPGKLSLRRKTEGKRKERISPLSKSNGGSSKKRPMHSGKFFKARIRGATQIFGRQLIESQENRGMSQLGCVKSYFHAFHVLYECSVLNSISRAWRSQLITRTGAFCTASVKCKWRLVKHRFQAEGLWHVAHVTSNLRWTFVCC